MSYRFAHAARSAAALVLAAAVAYQRGITRLELPNASLAAFVAILCTQRTLGGTLQFGEGALLGGALAAIVHAPCVALPAALRARGEVAGPLLLVQLVALTTPDVGFGMRLMASATCTSLTLSPLIDARALGATYALEALGVIALGVGAAVCAAALPPRRSARAALVEHGARAACLRAEAFAHLVRAFASGDEGKAPSLLRPAFLLQQLKSLEADASELHSSATREPACTARHPAALAADSARGACAARQLEHMLRALRAHERDVAEGALVGSAFRRELHAEYARYLNPPLLALVELARRHAADAPAARGCCSGTERHAQPDTRDAEEEVRGALRALHLAWVSAQSATLFPPAGYDGASEAAAIARFQRPIPHQPTEARQTAATAGESAWALRIERNVHVLSLIHI